MQDIANMKQTKREVTIIKKEIKKDDLFDRIVSILEQARSNVVRSVNINMVTAYWLIGKEIVQEIQGGDERAEYGKRIVEGLSKRLTERYGKGFSTASLWNFRQFYQAYSERTPAILYLEGREFQKTKKLSPQGRELADSGKSHPQGSESKHGFSPRLSWSHYRALMRIDKTEIREFYEQEAIACSWDKRSLERQIHSFFYERLLASKDKRGMLLEARNAKINSQSVTADVLKDPYVFEFLDLPDIPMLHESQLEQAIIDNLQSFLLEMGKGFSFVSRQQRMRFEDEDFYIDLVFYNYLLKCFVLIDLKMGKLTHEDVGKMDSYVRMFEETHKDEGNNPAIGLILCSNKNEAIVKYSVLAGSKQLFASKYLLYLPTEDELKKELQRERRMIEGHRKAAGGYTMKKVPVQANI